MEEGEGHINVDTSQNAVFFLSKAQHISMRASARGSVRASNPANTGREATNASPSTRQAPRPGHDSCNPGRHPHLLLGLDNGCLKFRKDLHQAVDLRGQIASPLRVKSGLVDPGHLLRLRLPGALGQARAGLREIGKIRARHELVLALAQRAVERGMGTGKLPSDCIRSHRQPATCPRPLTSLQSCPALQRRGFHP